MAALVAAAIAAAAIVPAAFADGDPASDVLVSQIAFVPSDANASAREQAQLSALLQTARRSGFPIRVAIIPDGYDLGSVTALWRRPRSYAEFLGIELSYVHRQPLLVVMPNGMGFYWQGHSSGAANGQLARIPVRGDLIRSAETAVRALAGDAGHQLRVESAGSGGNSPLVLVAVGLGLLAAVGGALAYRRRRRRPQRRAPVAAPPPARTHAPSVRMRWAIPGVALLACVATGIPILAVVTLRSSGRGAPAQAGVVTPFRWAAGQRPAPNFRLTDQNGHPITLAAYRGRPVIITFVDPLCRNLCPLAAHVLNEADATLPASQRPEIIAVSVDIYADTRADMLQDFRRWSLVPQWRWAVGRPGQLASVWKDYRVAVQVTTKRIAGTTVHFITHDELAYVIDPAGDVRDLLIWPYYPQDVVKLVREVAQA